MKLTTLQLVALHDLVDSLGVGGLLEQLAEHCEEQADFCREDHGERDPEAAAWERWAELLRELPLRAPTAAVPVGEQARAAARD